MTNWDYMNLGAQQGWQCSVCGRVNAPWLPSCPCGGQANVRLSYSTGTDYDLDREKYLKKYQKELDEILDFLNESIDNAPKK